MLKKWLTFLLLSLTITANAQSTSGGGSNNQGGSSSGVNEAVSKCLGSSSTTAGSKTSCVQSAIANESTNQINTLYQLYTQFVAQDLANLNSGSGGGTGGVTSGSGGPSGSVGNTPKPPAARPAPPPASGGTQTAPPPPPPTAQPQKQNQGGIQYY